MEILNIYNLELHINQYINTAHSRSYDDMYTKPLFV